jgi:hypothetical protein
MTISLLSPPSRAISHLRADGHVDRTAAGTDLYDSPKGGVFTHGATWGGHPVSTTVAVANITAMRYERVLERPWARCAVVAYPAPHAGARTRQAT